ncbi:kelch domain-containing protein 10 [Patella vulgata]|uniref:kelch domain-containing protein 10 n=1 Tax=Patella vulgata TaxID=6465 RepID=UPI00217FF99D|nr:kelch domain-containing protein 10 [Patella vulgata]
MSSPGVGFERVYVNTDIFQNTEQPEGRSGHSMVADESNLYVFGGYVPAYDRPCDSNVTHNECNKSKILVEVWRFNFATRKWTQLEAEGIPDTCASSCLALHGKKLFVYGGTGYPFGQMMSNTIKVCECRHVSKSGAGSYWYLIETNPNVYNALDSGDNMPRRAYGQSLIFHENNIYTFGGAIGFHEEAVAELHKLDVHTKSWERLAPSGDLPIGRYKQEVACDKDRFYLFGGGRLHYAETLAIVYAYHFKNNRWDAVATRPDSKYGYPKCRCSFSLVEVESSIYVCGGITYSYGNTQQSLDDIWTISLIDFQWRKLSVRLPEPLYFHRASVSPSGFMYLFGGVLPSGQRSNQIYRWRIPHHISPLSELCWETVTRNFKSIDKETQLCLEMYYGIPNRFTERIF